MVLLSQKHVIRCKSMAGSDLRAVAVRYTKETHPSSSAGNILVFAHAVGCHKEQWLPILERLWVNLGVNISEAWSIEGPNHGDSLSYNKEVLDKDAKDLSDLANYGQVMLGFIDSGLVDYQHRHLIAIVHSAGCQAVIHAATVLQGNGKPIPFKSVVLVEPVLLPSDVCEALLSRLVQPTASRKWQWKSRDEASQYVTKAFPWKSWHKDMQDVFLEHGMIHTFERSQLKLPSHVEASCYPNTKAQVDGLKNLPTLCEKIPIHVLFGARYDLVPKKFRDPFVTAFKDRVVSLQWIEGAGHMLPQENPDGCAQALSVILRGRARGGDERSKL